MPPVLPVYGRWVASWDAALAALTSAGLIGALNPDETARQRKAIAIERELVVKRLTLLTRKA